VSTFLAGCDSMEFGWLLMSWIPAVRAMSRKYDHTVVVCRKENEYLYRDFTDRFFHHEINRRPDRWYANWDPIVECKIPDVLKKKINADKVWEPEKKYCMNRPLEYVRYGERTKDWFHLVIHARAENKYGQTGRNWGEKRYYRLVKAIRKQMNIRVACIGTNAYKIPHVYDRTNIPLSQLCDILHSSKLLIGESSGPMHLGELCGIPRVVWTDDSKHKILGNRTNKWRYKKYWHPFKTPVTVIDEYGWRPPDKFVFDTVTDTLRKVRRKK